MPFITWRFSIEDIPLLGFTHYENLINLHLLIGRGRFRFIGLPLKIRGGTGSPVRAIAVFENNR
jgi:kynurenine formamidase